MELCLKIEATGMQIKELNIKKHKYCLCCYFTLNMFYTPLQLVHCKAQWKMMKHPRVLMALTVKRAPLPVFLVLTSLSTLGKWQNDFFFFCLLLTDHQDSPDCLVN